jgi:hypothetical protein
VSTDALAVATIAVTVKSYLGGREAKREMIQCSSGPGIRLLHRVLKPAGFGPAGQE